MTPLLIGTLLVGMFLIAFFLGVIAALDPHTSPPESAQREIVSGSWVVIAFVVVLCVWSTVLVVSVEGR